MNHWTEQLPTLSGDTVALRELCDADAMTLFSMLTEEEVSRFISPPPTSVEGFARFIGWTHGQREAGKFVCFAVLPHGFGEPVGIFQLRTLDAAFDVAEWGFVVAQPFWGTGLFEEAAQLMLEFAFDVVGVHRLEARAAVPNGRGQGALAKVGAVREAGLRRSFTKNGIRMDQVMWSILAEDWRLSQKHRREHEERRGDSNAEPSNQCDPRGEVRSSALAGLNQRYSVGR